MRAFVNCSEPVRHDSHGLFLERFSHLGLCPEKLAVSYAMAETVLAVTQTTLGCSANIDWVDGPAASDSRALPQVSCGSPIDGVEIRIVSSSGDLLMERHIGEIFLRSSFMLDIYYRRDDLQTLDAQGWYHTGDMGYLADSELYVVGRSKDLIINAGKNIYPQDIEAIVNTIPGIYPGRVVAFGVTDAREGTELIAVVAELELENPGEKPLIKRLIRERVSQQTMATVSYVELVDPRWLIKTSSGKIARAANRDKWFAERQRSNSNVSGTTNQA
jgi:acyl-CoA synthetase (AMP-forming)/AMP-acid ligase II